MAGFFEYLVIRPKKTSQLGNENVQMLWHLITNGFEIYVQNDLELELSFPQIMYTLLIKVKRDSQVFKMKKFKK